MRGCACREAEQESKWGGRQREVFTTARTQATTLTNRARSLNGGGGGGEVVEERHRERDAARWHVSIAERSGARLRCIVARERESSADSQRVKRASVKRFRSSLRRSRILGEVILSYIRASERPEGTFSSWRSRYSQFLALHDGLKRVSRVRLFVRYQ